MVNDNVNTILIFKLINNKAKWKWQSNIKPCGIQFSRDLPC